MMEVQTIEQLRQVMETMRAAGCGRLTLGTMVIELWPSLPATDRPDKRIEGTGTEADGLPVGHPGLRGIRLPNGVKPEESAR